MALLFRFLEQAAQKAELTDEDLVKQWEAVFGSMQDPGVKAAIDQTAAFLQANTSRLNGMFRQ